MSQVGFAFDEESHLYLLDGKPLTGVTTILKVIAKPNLIQWAADECAKFLGWYNEKYDDGTGQGKLAKRLKEVANFNDKQYQECLAEARLAHRRKKEAAGDIGTRIHKWIEKAIKSQIENIWNDPPDNDIRGMANKFCDWVEVNDVKFLESEKKVYSREHWFAGTVDMVFEMGGKKYIGDVKTSSAIYNEHFFPDGWV